MRERPSPGCLEVSVLKEAFQRADVHNIGLVGSCADLTAPCAQPGYRLIPKRMRQQITNFRGPHAVSPRRRFVLRRVTAF